MSRGDWADQATGLAPEHWCRAVGWYAMALVDVLDAIPADQPRRPQLLQILSKLATALEKYQDPASGRWFQVIDYQAVARRGYEGVLARLSVGADGRTTLADISVGTNVGDYAYYVGRTRATNDFHGLGAFLIMNEQLRGDRVS